jgi:hypothetical protein
MANSWSFKWFWRSLVEGLRAKTEPEPGSAIAQQSKIIPI